MLFYLGTHEVSWLGRTDVPLFVSANRLRKRRALPRAIGPWALDSGGFTELSRHGRWTVPAHQYADEVRAWGDAIGRMSWAAPQDWMCEPQILAQTGMNVAEHQRRTVESVVELRSMGADVIPVVQGWRVADYLRCVEMYASVGIDLMTERIVGVGTVCRRQSTAEGRRILATVAGLGIRVHGFGIKRTAIRAGDIAIASADSMAWSFHARRGQIRMPGHTHRTCANCMEFALQWRARTTDDIRTNAAQGDLFRTPETP